MATVKEHYEKHEKFVGENFFSSLLMRKNKKDDIEKWRKKRE